MQATSTRSWDEGQPALVPDGWEYHLQARPDTTGSWQVSVALPPPAARERAGSGLLPALYLLDGSFTFAVAAGVARTTMLFAGSQLGPLAVVGIAPRTDDPGEIDARRNRDLTPTVASGDLLDGDTPHGTGGAVEMLALIEEEIAPHLESIHPLDPADRGLGGWSLGGLFTCWAALTGSSAFRRFLAVSPSLWWDDRLLVDPRRLPAGPGGAADVYMAVGELEAELAGAWPAPPPGQAEGLAAIDMVADLDRVADRIANLPRTAVRAETIADEGHATVWAAAATRGIVHLYRSDRSGPAAEAA